MPLSFERATVGGMPTGVADDGEVQLWLLNLGATETDAESLGEVLSSDERQRAARLHFSRDRDAFTISRAALRHLLGTALDCRPERLTFEQGRYGKLQISAPAAHGLEFNVSHSGDYALFALTRGTSVGVDLEQVRAVPEAESIANRHFTAVERQAIASYGAEERMLAFFRVWTRKEACLKALGLGLFGYLGGFSVPVDRDGSSTIAARVQADGESRLLLRGFTPCAGYEGAVALAEGGGGRVHRVVLGELALVYPR